KEKNVPVEIYISPTSKSLFAEVAKLAAILDDGKVLSLFSTARGCRRVGAEHETGVEHFTEDVDDVEPNRKRSSKDGFGTDMGLLVELDEIAAPLTLF